MAVEYAEHKQQQFDILAASMRQHIDIESIYKIMKTHRQGERTVILITGGLKATAKVRWLSG